MSHEMGDYAMRKVLGGLVAAVAMVLASWTGATTAQAYGEPEPPTVESQTPPTVQSGPPPSIQTKTPTNAAALPNTGGPSGLLLGGAVGLLVVGGTVITVARRRETD